TLTAKPRFLWGIKWRRGMCICSLELATSSRPLNCSVLIPIELVIKKSPAQWVSFRFFLLFCKASLFSALIMAMGCEVLFIGKWFYDLNLCLYLNVSQI